MSKVNIYCLIDWNETPCYIGISINDFETRLKTHKFNKLDLINMKRALIVQDESDLEPILVGFYKPYFNEHYTNREVSIKELQRISGLSWVDYHTEKPYLVNNLPFSTYSVINSANVKNCDSVVDKIAYFSKKGIDHLIESLVSKENKKIKKQHKKRLKLLEELDKRTKQFTFRVTPDIRFQFEQFRKKCKSNKTINIDTFFNKLFLDFIDNKINISDNNLSHLLHKLEKQIIININAKTLFLYFEKVNENSKKRYIPGLLFIERLDQLKLAS